MHSLEGKENAKETSQLQIFISYESVAFWVSSKVDILGLAKCSCKEEEGEGWTKGKCDVQYVKGVGEWLTTYQTTSQLMN